MSGLIILICRFIFSLILLLFLFLLILPVLIDLLPAFMLGFIPFARVLYLPLRWLHLNIKISTVWFWNNFIRRKIVVVLWCGFVNWRMIDQIHLIDSIYFFMRIILESFIFLLKISILFCLCFRDHLFSWDVVILMGSRFMDWSVINQIKVTFCIDFLVRVVFEMFRFWVDVFITAGKLLYLCLLSLMLSLDFLNVDTKELWPIFNFFISERFVRV